MSKYIKQKDSHHYLLPIAQAISLSCQLNNPLEFLKLIEQLYYYNKYKSSKNGRQISLPSEKISQHIFQYIRAAS